MELRDLTDVLTADGPFVTVLVESESAVEQAAQKYDLVWKDVARDLADRGVDEQTVEAVLAAKGAHDEGRARLVVATPDDHRVQLAVSLRHAPRRQVVDVSPLPHLVPLVDELSTGTPHVIVRADRSGAEVSAVSDAGRLVTAETLDPAKGAGPDPRGPSKWQHTAHQHELEAGWTGGLAQDIAQSVTELAAHVGARVVVGVGDVRELTAIRDHLPHHLEWSTVEGGRGGDGSEDLVTQRVRDVVARWSLDQSLQLLEDYAQERGQLKRAVDGVEDVVAALRKAQVRTLLITTDTPEGTLFFGPEPAQVGVTREELVDLGVPLPSEGPLVDVLLRAALGTGADVQLVAHELETSPNEGVGALLRYADA